MKRVIRLSESDITRIVKRVLNEEEMDSSINGNDSKVKVRVMLNTIKPKLKEVFEKNYVKQLDGNDELKDLCLRLVDDFTRKLADGTYNFRLPKIDTLDLLVRLHKNTREDKLNVLSVREPINAFFVDMKLGTRITELIENLIQYSNKTKTDYSVLKTLLNKLVPLLDGVKYIPYEKGGVKVQSVKPNGNDEMDIVRK